MKIIHAEKKIDLTRYEQETIINFNNGDRQASLYTCDPVILKYMEKISNEFPDIFVLEEEYYGGGELLSRTYTFPKKYARPKRPIVLSEERKEELRKQLAENINKSKEENDQ